MILRKMEAFDAPWVVKWRNDNRHWFGDQEPLTTQRHRAWFNETYIQDPGDHMYLVQNAAGVGVGTIGIHLPDGQIQRVLLGDREIAEPGTMSLALKQIMYLYNLNLYWLRVRRNNPRAIRFYEKNGFRGTDQPGLYLTMKRGRNA